MLSKTKQKRLNERLKTEFTGTSSLRQPASWRRLQIYALRRTNYSLSPDERGCVYIDCLYQNIRVIPPRPRISWLHIGANIDPNQRRYFQTCAMGHKPPVRLVASCNNTVPVDLSGLRLPRVFMQQWCNGAMLPWCNAAMVVLGGLLVRIEKEHLGVHALSNKWLLLRLSGPLPG